MNCSGCCFLEYQCPSGRVKCADGIECVRIDRICDGREHCRDDSDEDKVKCKGKHSSQHRRKQ